MLVWWEYGGSVDGVAYMDVGGGGSDAPAERASAGLEFFGGGGAVAGLVCHFGSLPFFSSLCTFTCLAAVRCGNIASEWVVQG